MLLEWVQNVFVVLKKIQLKKNLKNLIPFIKVNLALHVSQSHDFDIWLSLNNTTTHAFFPNISVSPITLFHQINKKELHLHITPMKKI